MTHVILENTICGNAGDGSIMLGAEKILKEACGDDVEILVYDHDSENSKDLYLEQEFRQMFSKELGTGKAKWAMWAAKNNLWFLASLLGGKELASGLRDYKTAEMIFTTGGSYLNENYNLADRIKQFQAELYLENPPVFLTQSMGPFRTLENQKGFKPVFNESPLILLRDEQSKRYLNGLVEQLQKCFVLADMSFALAEIPRIEKLLRQPNKPKLEKIAISVRDWPYFKKRPYRQGMETYLEAIGALAQKLIRDYEVDITFISTCQGMPHFKYNDAKIAKVILDQLPREMKPHVHIEDEFHHPSELMDILREMDLVVATRLHMISLSMCVGTPVLPIAYEFKTTEMIRKMGFKELLSNVENITAGDLIGKTDLLLSSFEEYRRKMLKATMVQHKSAMQAVPLIRRIYEYGEQTRFNPQIQSDVVDNDENAYSAAE